jgi:hypothetical protein
MELQRLLTTVRCNNVRTLQRPTRWSFLLEISPVIIPYTSLRQAYMHYFHQDTRRSMRRCMIDVDTSYRNASGTAFHRTLQPSTIKRGATITKTSSGLRTGTFFWIRIRFICLSVILASVFLMFFCFLMQLSLGPSLHTAGLAHTH